MSEHPPALNDSERLVYWDVRELFIIYKLLLLYGGVY